MEAGVWNLPPSLYGYYDMIMTLVISEQRHIG